MTKISEHFSIDEVQCHCGCGYSLINRELLDMLEKARKLACVKFIINSWCRCQTYNDSLPNSVPDSAHIKGKAVDISAKLNKQIILKSLRKAGFKRIGIAKGFIHADISTNKPQGEWTY
jgi:hypothetical protein